MSLVALITGASSGIGAATAGRLAAEPGAELILVARRTERLQELAASLSAPATYLAADVTDPDAPGRIASHLAECHDGRLTLLVNNARASWREGFPAMERRDRRLTRWMVSDAERHPTRRDDDDPDRHGRSGASPSLSRTDVAVADLEPWRRAAALDCNEGP